MKKLLLLSVFLSSNTWAEWTIVAYHEDTRDDFYIDYATIESNGNLAYAWTMTNFLVASEDGTASVTAFYEVNCKAPKKFRVLSFQTYDTSMADGAFTNTTDTDSDFTFALPGSVVEVIISRICSSIGNG